MLCLPEIKGHKLRTSVDNRPVCMLKRTEGKFFYVHVELYWKADLDAGWECNHPFSQKSWLFGACRRSLFSVISHWFCRQLARRMPIKKGYLKRFVGFFLFAEEIEFGTTRPWRWTQYSLWPRSFPWRRRRKFSKIDTGKGKRRTWVSFTSGLPQA